MPNPIVEKIVVPENEIQPDRDAELDNSLSKLFNSNDGNAPEVSQAPKEIENPVEQVKEGNDTRKTESKISDDNKVSETEKLDDNFEKKPSKEGWKILRDSHAKSKKTILEKDQELAKLKTSLAEKGQVTSQEAETLKKEIEELKTYRGMVDLQADPEFIQKFDDPIKEKTEKIASIMTEWGVAQEIIQKIDYTDSGLLDRIKDTIAENKDSISSKKFMRAAEEINDLYDKRTEHLDEYRKNFKTIVETKKKEVSTKQAEEEGLLIKSFQEIDNRVDDKGNKMYPYFTDRVTKDPSNQSEIEQVERHNNASKFLRDMRSMASAAKTPKERAERDTAAALVHYYAAEAKAWASKAESLQSELSKISKSSSETPKSQKTRVNHSPDKDNLDLDSAMSTYFQGVK